MSEYRVGERAEVLALGGIHPIVYAFFDEEGRIDAALMRRQVAACLAVARMGSPASGSQPRWAS
jgi:hypothetical protein